MDVYDYSNMDYPETGKKKKHKKSKKEKKEKQLGAAAKPTLLDRYNGMETKSNVNNSLLKSLVDVAAGVLVGPVVSAALGKFAPVAGAALSFAGHYTGDKTGALRGIGIGTLAHSVAKTKEYRDSGSTMADRFSELKDDWLRLVFLKKSDANEISGLEPSNSLTESLPHFLTIDPEPKESVQPPVEKPDFDLSSLDKFERQLEESAKEYGSVSGVSLEQADNWTQEEEDKNVFPDIFGGYKDFDDPDYIDFSRF